MKYLHTMVRVRDLDASLEFYCDHLGLVETRRYESEPGRFTLVFLAAPDDKELAAERNAPLLELTYNWDPRTTTVAATSVISPTKSKTSMRRARS